MRRPLALLAAVLALAAPPARAGEPLDMDITRLGPPSAYVWALTHCSSLPCATTPEDEALASDARMRFAMLSSELALSLSSALLQPAATVGHSGFAFDLEVAYTQVHKEVVGTAPPFPAAPATPAFPRNYWPTRTKTPAQLVVPSFHVRKSLPYSLELGGRILHISQSSYAAAQLTLKWAIQEGYAKIPDVAVMAAHTIFLGQKDLNLSSTDLTLVTSKRFGVNAVTSLTPYLAFRLLRVKASSDPIGYAPDQPRPAGRPHPGGRRGRRVPLAHPQPLPDHPRPAHDGRRGHHGHRGHLVRWRQLRGQRRLPGLPPRVVAGRRLQVRVRVLRQPGRQRRLDGAARGRPGRC